jgi:hypothetical protein
MKYETQPKDMGMGEKAISVAAIPRSHGFSMAEFGLFFNGGAEE